MRRREFIAFVGSTVAAWPMAARAQQARIAQIGFLGATTAAGYAKLFSAFQAGLHDLGYLEGKNIVIHSRWAEEKYDRLAALANELVALKVDVLVTHGTPATTALKKATTTIPIVMAVSGDADRTGLIQNLARPGGNVTGMTYFASEQAGKRLELLGDVLPTLNRAAFLTNPENPLAKLELEAIEKSARSLKIEVRPFEVRSAADFNDAFSLIVKTGCNAVETAQDALMVVNISHIAALALDNRLPTVGETFLPKAGGPLGFGPNLSEMFRRAAYFVARLLHGDKASDLPVERPTKFELAINLKTAKTLALTITGSIIARADEVIE